MFAIETMKTRSSAARSAFEAEFEDRLAGKALEADVQSGLGFDKVRALFVCISRADDDVSRAACECLAELSRVCLYVLGPLVDDSECPASRNDAEGDSDPEEKVGDWMSQRGLGILETLAKRLLGDERQSLHEIEEAVSSWVSMYCLRRELRVRGVGSRDDLAERDANRVEAQYWEHRARDFLLAVRNFRLDGRGELRVGRVAPEDDVLLRVTSWAELDLHLRSEWRALFDARGSEAASRDLVMAVLERFAGPNSDSGLEFTQLVQRHKDWERLALAAAMRRSLQ